MIKWLKKLFTKTPSIKFTNIPKDAVIHIHLAGGSGGSGGSSGASTNIAVHSGGQAVGNNSCIRKEVPK